MRKGNSLYAFLESRGVLERADEDEIKAAKREYKKIWYRKYRKETRQKNPIFGVSISKANGDYFKIANGAKRHKLPITTFLRVASLAYLNRSFILLNPDQVIRIEQLLMACLNEVQAIAHRKEKHHWDREQKYDAIAERIGALENEIRHALRFPKEANP